VAELDEAPTYEAGTMRVRTKKGNRYKGVYRTTESKRWEAHIGYLGKQHYLGMFKTPEEAARCYDQAAKKFYGEFAKLNFPEGRIDQLVGQQP
jgi:hypothetical protein